MTEQPLSLWRRMSRHSFLKGKISRRNLQRLCREYATGTLTLVVHSEDVPYKRFFPNAFTVTKRPDRPADMHVDLHYRDLSKIADESYEVILCTGLLEHIPDPQRLVDDLRRILKPGGRLIISASAVFSFHECPDDFFHFTPFSFRMMFQNWSRIEMLRGSSQPFETLAILLQRVLIQCDIFPPVRPVLELLVRVFPFFDRLIIAQYDNYGDRAERRRIDSMMPSNIQACVIK